MVTIPVEAYHTVEVYVSSCLSCAVYLELFFLDCIPCTVHILCSMVDREDDSHKIEPTIQQTEQQLLRASYQKANTVEFSVCILLQEPIFWVSRADLFLE